MHNSVDGVDLATFSGRTTAMRGLEVAIATARCPLWATTGWAARVP